MSKMSKRFCDIKYSNEPNNKKDFDLKILTWAKSRQKVLDCAKCQKVFDPKILRWWNTLRAIIARCSLGEPTKRARWIAPGIQLQKFKSVGFFLLLVSFWFDISIAVETWWSRSTWKSTRRTTVWESELQLSPTLGRQLARWGRDVWPKCQLMWL